MMLMLVWYSGTDIDICVGLGIDGNIVLGLL